MKHNGIVACRPSSAPSSELRRLRHVTSYTGLIEVELCNGAIWDEPGEAVLERMKKWYLEHVLELKQDIL